MEDYTFKMQIIRSCLMYALKKKMHSVYSCCEGKYPSAAAEQF